MSLKSWKREFYGSEASKAARRGPVAAVRHSIRKWLGLREPALTRHGVEVRGNRVWEPLDYLLIDCDTCALCCRFLGGECPECPLCQTLAGQCDQDRNSPYRVWINTGDPEPMIAALRKTLRRLLSKKSSKTRVSR